MSSFLLVSVVFFLLWLLVLFLSIDTRKEQLIMSVVGLVLAPGALLLAFEDYRGALFEGVTAVGIEDLLFAFSLCGIAAVLYQALLGKQAAPAGRSRKKIKTPALHWAAHLVIILGLWMFISLLTVFSFDVASRFAFHHHQGVLGLFYPEVLLSWVPLGSI